MVKPIFESPGTRVGESYSKTTLVTERKEIAKFDLVLGKNNHFIDIDSIEHDQVLRIQIWLQHQFFEKPKVNIKDQPIVIISLLLSHFLSTMIEFEDQEYAQELLHLAERAKRAPNLIKKLSDEDLNKAWRWIEKNVLHKMSGSEGKTVWVRVVTDQTTLLNWFLTEIKNEIAKRDTVEVHQLNESKFEGKAQKSSEFQQTKHIFMNKTKIGLAVITAVLTLAAIFAVFKYGGKISLPGGTSIEHNPTSNLGTSDETRTPLTVTIVGTVRLNGKTAQGEDVVRVYIKGNTLVPPVGLDGNAFIIKGVSLPENKIVRVALDLKDGQSLSQLFQLPHPKDGISDLGELILTSASTSSIDGRSKSSSPRIIINNQNVVGDNNQNMQEN